MKTAAILLIIGILLLALGLYLWQKRDREQPFWVTFIETVADIATGMAFSSFRAWALFSWLLGLVFVILGILAFYNNYFT